MEDAAIFSAIFDDNEEREGEDMHQIHTGSNGDMSSGRTWVQYSLHMAILFTK